MLLSVVTDTIVYPRAVMIHTSDTSLANGTVMWVRRFDRVALLALLGHDFVKESHIPSIHNYTACALICKWLPILFAHSIHFRVHPLHNWLKGLPLLILDHVRCSLSISRTWPIVIRDVYSMKLFQIKRCILSKAILYLPWTSSIVVF